MTDNQPQSTGSAPLCALPSPKTKFRILRISTVVRPNGTSMYAMEKAGEVVGTLLDALDDAHRRESQERGRFAIEDTRTTRILYWTPEGPDAIQ